MLVLHAGLNLGLRANVNMGPACDFLHTMDTTSFEQVTVAWTYVRLGAQNAGGQDTVMRYGRRGGRHLENEQAGEGEDSEPGSLPASAKKFIDPSRQVYKKAMAATAPSFALGKPL